MHPLPSPPPPTTGEQLTIWAEGGHRALEFATAICVVEGKIIRGGKSMRKTGGSTSMGDPTERRRGGGDDNGGSVEGRKGGEGGGAGGGGAPGGSPGRGGGYEGGAGSASAYYAQFAAGMGGPPFVAGMGMFLPPGAPGYPPMGLPPAPQGGEGPSPMPQLPASASPGFGFPFYPPFPPFMFPQGMTAPGYPPPPHPRPESGVGGGGGGGGGRGSG